MTKGFKVETNFSNGIKLTITDGFKIDFEFQILGKTFKKFFNVLTFGGLFIYMSIHFVDNEELAQFYGFSAKSSPNMIAFILDGGPKVASCVINDKLYNAAPSGWKFFPREFGEIGGNNIEINSTAAETVKRFMIFDRALMTSECIDLYKKLLF